MNRTLQVVLLLTAAIAAAGCRSNGNVCGKQALYMDARSIPTIRIPPGLESPDTRAAMKIPDVDTPELPPRKKGEGCLDEPPRYTNPTGPKPAPAT